MQFTHILMDLDGTVFDFDYAEKAAFKDLCRDFEIEYTEERYLFYRKANAERWKQLEKGLCERKEVVELRFMDFLEEFHIERDGRAMSKRFIDHLVMNTKPFPMAGETLEKIKEKYVLDAVTNASTAAQHGKLKAAGMENLFHKLFISEDIGYPKPSSEFFDFVFSYYKGVPKEEFLLVGDSLSADIKGANLSGIKSVWVRNNKDYEEIAQPDFVIESISDLGALL